jgi:hypothetical protein
VKNRFSSKLKRILLPLKLTQLGEKSDSAKCDELTSPETLEKLSTHGPISEEQRKKSELDNDMIRAIIVRAKASTQLSPFTDNLLEKIDSAATKVRILFTLTINRYSKLRF